MIVRMFAMPATRIRQSQFSICFFWFFFSVKDHLMINFVNSLFFEVAVFYIISSCNIFFFSSSLFLYIFLPKFCRYYYSFILMNFI